MADKKDKKAEEKEEKDKDKDDKADKEKGKDGEAAEGEEGAEGEGEGSGKASRKKKLIIAAAGVVLLIVGGAGAAFMSGAFSKGDASHEEGAENAGEHGEGGVALPQITYLDMDEFLVNLNTGGKQNSFLKMKVTLEIPSASEKAAIESQMPRVRDSFQIYLRELRASDLQGAGGMQRLREELLLRINKIIYPAKVSDILFKEIIVQ